MIQVYQPNPIMPPDPPADDLPTIRLWCDRCECEREFLFAGEDEQNEYYSCAVCGQAKTFAVR